MIHLGQILLKTTTMPNALLYEASDHLFFLDFSNVRIF